jgi:hypothetical protein
MTPPTIRSDVARTPVRERLMMLALERLQRDQTRFLGSARLSRLLHPGMALGAIPLPSRARALPRPDGPSESRHPPGTLSEPEPWLLSGTFSHLQDRIARNRGFPGNRRIHSRITLFPFSNEDKDEALTAAFERAAKVLSA